MSLGPGLLEDEPLDKGGPDEGVQGGGIGLKW